MDPQSNVMYPLCGMRCGFEAVTPLEMAGHVNKWSMRVVNRWKKLSNTVIQKQQGRGRKMLGMIQRSCNRIQCTAGSLYTFEHSIVLCSINNCILTSLNLLITFGRDT